MYHHHVSVDLAEPFPAFLAEMCENGFWKHHLWVPVALTIAWVRQALETTAGTFRNCVGVRTWT